MKSRTSFFNWTAFKKDVTRFAPAWGLYFVGMLLIMVSAISDSQPSAARWDIEEHVSVMAVINLIYAMVTAQLLFGDLFNSRLCNGLHALPLRRENWFITHTAAGMAFSLVPNLLLALIMLPRLDIYWGAAFLWWGAVGIQYLFFFSVAALSVMCTGSRFAMAVVYGLINFMAMVAWWFADIFYAPLLWGVLIEPEQFYFLSPVAWMCSHTDWMEIFWWGSAEDLNACWLYLMVLGAISPAVLGGALAMYRRRKLERAGDFIAVDKLRPVFLVIYTLAAGALIQWFYALFFGGSDGYVYLFAGLVIGYLTGHMLIKRSTRVFTRKMVLGGVALGAVVAASIGLVWLDPVGITRWVPEQEQVQSVTVKTYGHYYYGIPVTDPEQIGELVEVHEMLVDRRDEGGSGSRLWLVYTMRDGSVIRRCYQFPTEEHRDIVRKVAPILSKPEHVFECEDWDEFVSGVYRIGISQGTYVDFEGHEAKELLEAMRLDCEAGKMCQVWDYRESNQQEVVWLEISTEGGLIRSVSVYNDCTNTLDWLVAHGVTEYNLKFVKE